MRNGNVIGATFLNRVRTRGRLAISTFIGVCSAFAFGFLIAPSINQVSAQVTNYAQVWGQWTDNPQFFGAASVTTFNNTPMMYWLRRVATPVGITDLTQYWIEGGMVKKCEVGFGESYTVCNLPTDQPPGDPLPRNKIRAYKSGKCFIPPTCPEFQIESGTTLDQGKSYLFQVFPVSNNDPSNPFCYDPNKACYRVEFGEWDEVTQQPIWLNQFADSDMGNYIGLPTSAAGGEGNCVFCRWGSVITRYNWHLWNNPPSHPTNPGLTWYSYGYTSIFNNVGQYGGYVTYPPTFLGPGDWAWTANYQ
jgi:hypothetical protein